MEYHAVTMPVASTETGMNYKQLASIATVALVGTFVGYAATVGYLATPSTTANYAAVSASVTAQPRLATAVNAGPADWLSDAAQNVATQFGAQTVAEPAVDVHTSLGQLPETLAGLSGSVGTAMSLGTVAVFAAFVFAYLQKQKKRLSFAPLSGFRQARPSTELKAGNPLNTFFDKRKTVVITGASSGLGLSTARALANSGKWYVIMGCRDVQKGKAKAEELGLDKESYEVMNLELESFRSVRAFCRAIKASGRKLDTLVCNAALYLPNQRSPSFTEDGFERCFQVNHLSHFLMIRVLLDDVQKSDHKRVIVVGSITGNNNTVGGGAVYPLADLGKLQGMKAGMKEPICMLDGKAWNGAKAYKDSKVCNMMTIRELHRRYHKQTGITFGTMYPGCIAETALFRQKRGWFRTLFPLFMKYVTGGYVSQEEAGDRLAECVDSPVTAKSGVYWSWNGGARTTAYFAPGQDGNWALTGAGGSGGSIFENEPSDLVRDPYTANAMYELCEDLLADEGVKKDSKADVKEPALA